MPATLQPADGGRMRAIQHSRGGRPRDARARDDRRPGARSGPGARPTRGDRGELHRDLPAKGALQVASSVHARFRGRGHRRGGRAQASSRYGSATVSHRRASPARTPSSRSAQADRLVALPEGLSTREGAAAMLQGMTAHYLATSVYALKPGDACLVHAAAGRRRPAALPDRQAAQRDRHRHRVHAREGGARARGGRGRSDPLHAAGLRRRGRGASPTARSSPSCTIRSARRRSPRASSASRHAGRSRCSASRAGPSRRSIRSCSCREDRSSSRVPRSRTTSPRATSSSGERARCSAGCAMAR